MMQERWAEERGESCPSTKWLTPARRVHTQESLRERAADVDDGARQETTQEKCGREDESHTEIETHTFGNQDTVLWC